MKPKYLNRHGNFRIANLFWETTNLERDTPVFTMKAIDFIDSKGNKIISAQKRFIECGDVTGYDFAIAELGSYEHYMALCEHEVIGPAIERWKEVIKSKVDSEAIKEVKRIATQGGTQVELSAAKYLANREYELKNSVGRPNKKQRPKKDAAKARQESIELKEEMERIGIHTH